MAGEIPDMRFMISFSLRTTPSLLTKSFVDADLNGVLSCLGGYTYITPGSSCLYLFTSMEILLIESMILPDSISMRIMLLCLPIISTMSLLDVVKPSSV